MECKEKRDEIREIDKKIAELKEERRYLVYQCLKEETGIASGAIVHLKSGATVQISYVDQERFVWLGTVIKKDGNKGNIHRIVMLENIESIEPWG